MDNFKNSLDLIFSHLTSSRATIEVVEAEDTLQVNVMVDPADSGALIGFHGETIDSLQLIVSLIFNNTRAVYQPVQVDINQYRQKRAQALIAMADKAVQQAVSSQREILLPPLSPSERRVIHVHLQDHEQASTYSEGVGKSRRLVIRPKSPQR